jgi:predicted DNA binding CopG/RHH family protein
MTKRVSIKPKTTTTVDNWVDSRQAADQENSEPTKRLTIDVPASLHTRIKIQCAKDGVVMAEEIRTLLEKHFPEESQ